MRSVRELAQEALDVQNASNLSGVIHSWSRAIGELWENARAGNIPDFKGTDTINRHPVNVLYADKVAALTGTQSLGADYLSDAYVAVHNLAMPDEALREALKEAYGPNATSPPQ